MKKLFNTIWLIGLVLSILSLTVVAYASIINQEHEQDWLDRVYLEAKSSSSNKIVDDGYIVEYIEFLDDIRITKK